MQKIRMRPCFNVGAEGANHALTFLLPLVAALVGKARMGAP